jgi:hypothetical protein
VNAAPNHTPTSAAAPGPLPNGINGHSRPLNLGQDLPPIDSDTTMYLLDRYFMYVNNATYSLFPQHAFMRWARSSAEKTRDERAILLAMLAVGSSFTDGQYAQEGAHCAQAARDTLCSQPSIHSLAAVQTRFLLGVYHAANGSPALAPEDYIASAIQSTCNSDLCLGREEERGAGRAFPNDRIPFAFTREQYAELRRRTLWACFLADRYRDGMLCAIKVSDIFIRLPCSNEVYERGVRSDAPYYNNGIVDETLTPIGPSSPVAPMAWLVLVAITWGDVLDFTNRAVHRTSRTYHDAYEACYSETDRAWQTWSSRFPDELRYEDINLRRSIEGGYSAEFLTLHALHHFTQLRLNRYARHELLGDVVTRNIRVAHHHAQALLTMMSKFLRIRQEVAAARPYVNTLLTTPFLGTALMSAIDVAGAGGIDNLRNTLDMMEGGLECLRELARFWSNSADQSKASERRYYEIKVIVTQPYKARSGAWLGNAWGVANPLEKEFGMDCDCIYGLEHDGRGDGYSRRYFAALQDASRPDGKPNAAGRPHVV